jgi:two-component sensor histidine kinase
MLWIFFSDIILEKLSPNIEFYTHAQTYKGWFYVVITTILIFSLLKIYISNKNAAIYSLSLKEEELKKELSDKELLLNEVHHRVKNNLQMLGSLIRLRIDSSIPPACVSSVEKIADQIQSLSLIYEAAYQEKQPSSIGINSYIRDITGYLHSGHPEPEKITVEYKVADSTISMDKAIPLGIIISEILSNSFEHAFDERTEGLIKLQFKIDNDKSYLLIEDNGIGFNPDEGDGIGLDLLHMLTDQLEGEIEIISKPGSTKTVLSFP